MDENNQPQQEEQTIDELKAKNEELLNNWKREAADFENFKKRKESEGRQVVEYAKEMTVLKLLPSLQSLEQVLRYAPTDEKYKDWVAGLKITILQLEKTMEELGVLKIKSLGQDFDHNLHEAVEEKDGAPGKILEEIQPGFTLNGKVIVPARVVVGKQVSEMEGGEQNGKFDPMDPNAGSGENI